MTDQTMHVAKVALEWWRAGQRSQQRLQTLVIETLNAYPAVKTEEALAAANGLVNDWEKTGKDWGPQ